MPEFLRDDYLRIALYDALRGVKLPTIRRALDNQDRDILADALFARIKQSGWDIVCYPERTHFGHLAKAPSDKETK
jgi:hypothetical protein